ncbi:phosphotransferase family protein [Kitasatospora sp. NPDC004289]
MRHGYTNHTVGDGSHVRKTYEGPDAGPRLARERELLACLAGELPVPPVLAADEGSLTLALLPGRPGQDLLDEGHAAEVLAACGTLLGRIHRLRPATPALGPGQVLVHGDFGPNNVLLDPATRQVTAVLDWEFAHPGAPVEDLAWCEWVVRMHHPGHRSALRHFFAAYDGPVPAWAERRAVMLTRCAELERFCERWAPGGPASRQWRERAAATAAWTE